MFPHTCNRAVRACTHTTVCSPEAAPFHVRMIGLFMGSQSPAGADVDSANPVQSSRGKGAREVEFLMTDERCMLIPVCGEWKRW